MSEYGTAQPLIKLAFISHGRIYRGNMSPLAGADLERGAKLDRDIGN